MKPLSESNVLIVDDTKMNVDVLVEALCEDYEISVALDGKTALEVIEQERPDLILLDIMMPEMSGYDVCRELKNNGNFKDIPVIFLTAMSDISFKTKAFEMGGVDYITKPFEIKEVKARVFTHLSLSRAKKEKELQNKILEEKVYERTKELLLLQDGTIEVVASLAEYRDPETGGHITRTKEFIRVLANQMNENNIGRPLFSNADIDMLCKTAPLHDLGKIGISDTILLKPGRLTDDEFEIMKGHTVIGYEAIRTISNRVGSKEFLRYALEMSRSHQEKWDGTGYPDQLKGRQIPISGRLMAVADVYDALISKRPYKEPFSHTKAVEIINEGSGHHFDPEIVEAFNQVKEEFKRIALEFADYDEEREAIDR